MNTTSLLKFLTFGLGATLVAAACTTKETIIERDGSGAADPGSGSGAGAGSAGSGAGSTGSADFVCCINDVNYACPSKAAFDQCIGFDIDGCITACDPSDFDCVDNCFAQLDMTTPDPSACNQDPNVSCDGPGPGPGGCSGDWDGTYCEVDGDCQSGNCTNDKCWGNDAGNPCEVDGDCTSGNCTAGCCYTNDAGQPCEVDGDCASGNCYQGTCQ